MDIFKKYLYEQPLTFVIEAPAFNIPTATARSCIDIRAMFYVFFTYKIKKDLCNVKFNTHHALHKHFVSKCVNRALSPE
jgi:hypothetical protein